MSSQNIKRNNKIFTEQFNRKFYTYNDNGLKYLDKDISKLETKLAKLKTIREKLVIKIEQGKISGQSQQKERAMSKLEEILDLQNSWKPLNSSYTTSGNSTDEGGRPEVDESEITDAGQNSKDYR